MNQGTGGVVLPMSVWNAQVCIYIQRKHNSMELHVFFAYGSSYFSKSALAAVALPRARAVAEVMTHLLQHAVFGGIQQTDKVFGLLIVAS